MFRYLLLLLAMNVTLCADQSAKAAIIVDNRVLTTVRDQIITVQDVVKKLDMLFYKNYPQYRSSPEARLEFYKMQWRQMVDDLVNRQLALSWAEERQFQVSHGDVREELEEMFGPDVMVNLYESGLSLHEVQEMIRADILLRRIIYAYVRLPILASITPRDVRTLYANKLKEASSQKVFCWKSITVKEKDTKECSRQVAEDVLNLFRKERLSLEGVREKIPAQFEVTLSQEYRSSREEIAPHIFELLSPLQEGSFSDLVPFSSKQDEHRGWRFYTVLSIENKKLPPLAEIEEELRGEIAYPEIEKQTKAFFDELRRQYHVKQLFTSQELASLEPFSMRSKSTNASL